MTRKRKGIIGFLGRKKMVFRSSDCQCDDSLLQRLSRLVNAASNGRLLGGKLHKRKAASSPASPPKGQPSPSGRGKSSGKSKPSPIGKSKSQSQPRVARSYTLLARHWEGQVVSEKDLLDSAATLEEGKMLVCGVVARLMFAIARLLRCFTQHGKRRDAGRKMDTCLPSFPVGLGIQNN